MFYTFEQNNSFGEWKLDEKVTFYVIVEADNANEANELAESHGVYFDGCSQGIDCPCCGDRWNAQWSDKEGPKSPEIWGESALEYRPNWYIHNFPWCRIYYKNGKVQELIRREEIENSEVKKLPV